MIPRLAEICNIGLNSEYDPTMSSGDSLDSLGLALNWLDYENVRTTDQGKAQATPPGLV